MMGTTKKRGRAAERNLSMKHRVFALCLVLVLLIGVFAGCSKKENGDSSDSSNGNSTVAKPTKNDQAQTTSKYVYKPTYINLPSEIAYTSGVTAGASTAWLVGQVKEGEKEESYTYTDENGEEQTETYTYDVYRSALFQIDLDSQTCTEATGVALPQVDEGWEGSVNIGDMQVMDDGSIWVCCDVYQYKTELPEDFDPETDDEWNYQQNEEKDVMLHLAADGSELGRFELKAPAETDDAGNSYSGSLSTVLVGNDGTIYGYDWTNVYLFDAEGNCTATISTDDIGGGSNLCRYDANTIGMTAYSYDQESQTSSNELIPINTETKTWDKDNAIKIPTDAWQIYPGCDGYDILYNYNNNIFGYIAKTDTKEKILDWMDSDINSNDMASFSVLDDGRVIATLSHYDSDTGEQTNEMVLMTRVDSSTLPNKTTLTLACFSLDYYLREQIVEFNKNSDEYRIVVKDYAEYNTDDDYSAGLTKLNTEIMSGVIPDMMITTNLPVDRYAAKGVLADLYTFIDNDSSLTRESFVQEVLKACETDGKLYELPTSFMVQTAYGLSKVVDGYDVWNVAAVQDAMTKLQEGAYVFDFYSTQADVMSTCVYNNLSTFVDWQTGKCSFDSEAFVALLNFAKGFPAEFDWDAWYNDPENSNNGTSDADMIRNGQKLLNRQYLYGFNDLLYSLGELGNAPITFVGYPSEDGTANHLFSTSGAFAISATCAAPDVAWTFLSQLVREDYQSGNNIWNFPVNKAAFDQSMEKAMTPEYQYDENGEIMLDENGEPIKYPKYSYYTTSVGSETAIARTTDSTAEDGRVDIYELSQEQADMVLDVIAKTTRVATYDESISNIVDDECAGFFAGQASAEETAAAIQSRVQLYVAEQS